MYIKVFYLHPAIQISDTETNSRTVEGKMRALWQTETKRLSLDSTGYITLISVSLNIRTMRLIR